MGLEDREYYRKEVETKTPGQNSGLNFPGLGGMKGLPKGVIIVSVCVALIVAATYFIKEIRNWSKPASAPSKHEQLIEVSPLDINLASMKELMLLPHINEDRAFEILKLRPIDNINRLDEVPGIGEKRLQQIKPHVYVDNRTINQRASED